MDTLRASAPHPVRVPLGTSALAGRLAAWPGASGLLVLPHVTGRSRPLADAVERALDGHDVALLSVDLLTPEEQWLDERMGHLRFDVPMLAGRLQTALAWAATIPELQGRPAGCFAT